MKNKDNQVKMREDLRNKLSDAVANKDSAAFVDGVLGFAEGLQKDLIAAASQFEQTGDKRVLSARGIRSLTSEEKQWYSDLATALKSSDPKQAITGIEKTIPLTIVDSVMEEIKANHPLLDAVDIQVAHGSTRWIYHDGTKPLSSWSALTSAITEEMASSIQDVEFSLSKLSSFIPVPKDLLDLGAEYLDAYARAILSEAQAYGYEHGFIDGNGKNQPIGMKKDISVNSGGVYSDKKAIEVTSLDIKTYCEIVAMVSKRPNNTSRVVKEVILVVNPTDYIKKIIPSTTVLATDGSYRGEIFPFPTKVIQSEELIEGEAVLGIANKYKGFMGKSTIAYDDSYKWLEDVRTYMAKTYGYGRPVDNNSFIKLDISGLKPRVLEVTVTQAEAEAEVDNG